MATTTERLPGARIALQIEVDQARVDKHMDRAVSRISKQVRIPGFRPGKADRKTVERHIGTAAILQEALEELVPEVYNEALEEQQIDAIDQPEFELESTDPLVVKATVPVRPEVDLGDYQALRVPKETTEVTEDQVQQTIEQLRRQFAVLEPVDRAIEWNDHVRADVQVDVEGHDETHTEEDAEFAVREGGVVSLPGFAERLVGLGIGEHSIEFTLADDLPSEELAGKQAKYQVTIHEVKREILPDLDDEFVASLDEEGVDTVAALDERIRSDLRTQGERVATEQYHNEIIDLLLATATLDYPDVLVNREVERSIDRESNHASHSPEGLANWLSAIGKTEDEVREMFREQADLTVRRALVLGELVSAEEIEVSEDQIDEEIENLISQMSSQFGGEGNRDAIRGMFDTPDGRTSIRSQLMTRFAIERLEEIASQPEAAEGAAPRRSSRRRRAGADTAEGAEGDEAGAEASGGAGDEAAGDASDEPDEQA
ncbi:MAG: trigger factor [Dehalococcoidia bacterium]